MKTSGIVLHYLVHCKHLDLVSYLFFSSNQIRIFWKYEFLFHEDNQYAGVYSPLRRHGISPLGLLIVKTLTNVL